MSTSIFVVSRRKQACRFHQSLYFLCCLSIASQLRKHFRKLRTWSTSSVQILLSGGNCPVAPSGCRPPGNQPSWLVTLQLFQNCFPRIFVAFPVCFLVFGAVMPLLIKTLSERISLATSQGTVVSHYYWPRNTFPPSKN